LRAITDINTTINITIDKMRVPLILDKEITKLKKIKPRLNQYSQHAMDQTE
jgi:hypothetical protein